MTQKKGKKKPAKCNAGTNEASEFLTELAASTTNTEVALTNTVESLLLKEKSASLIKESVETFPEQFQDKTTLPAPPSVEGEDIKDDPGEDAEQGEEEDLKQGEEGEISEKTRKNRLKKLKKKQAQQAKQADPEAKAKTQQSKKAPLNAVTRAALERLQLIKAQEEARRLEEERIRLEEEERERKLQEEQRLLEEEKERKRLAKLEKKEMLRAENKLLSQKDKSQQEKNKTYIDQLRSMGLLPHLPEGGEKTKRKVVAERIKRKKPLVEGTAMDALTSSLPVEEFEGKEALPTEAPLPMDESDALDTWEDWEDMLGALEAKNTPESEPSIGETVTSWKPPLLPLNPLETVHALNPSRGKKTASRHLPATSPLSLDSPPSALAERGTKTTAPLPTKLRSPVCCILGHVDTGKTKLLDKIRKTNVQDNEAGGITQQIGATFFPNETLKEQCIKIAPTLDLRLPGFLIIDTPGHESFNNLRARGSSLCDIAILVVDIMHGLEPQTKESLGLLRNRKCPFVIVLNKVDRLYDWKATEWLPFREALAQQPPHCKEEFARRLDEALLQLKEEGINCDLYWKNDDVRRTVSIVPTSALTGEGISDLLYLLVYLTQTIMTKSLVCQETLQCTILEVKNIDGLGVTIDVILLNGTLHEGDTIVVCGMRGPIVSTIRAMLTPQPLKELRIKSEYIHHPAMEAAMGVKIAAQGLDEAVAGTSLLVADETDDIEELKEEVMEDMVDIFKSVDRSGCGVYVMASTLGSLEALLQFLKDSKIPVFGVNIGTVQKRDVKKASVMREKDHPEYSVILAFDIKTDPEAEKEAATLGVKILSAEIIYHLFDAFTNYIHEFNEEKKKSKAALAVFPCELTVLPQYIFNKKDPIIVGVKVDAGMVKVGTPLVVPEKDFLYLGTVYSLEHNNKSVEKATKGQEICLKISGDPHIMYGRHFDNKNKIYSRVSRESIDCLKEHFRDEVSKDDWKLMLQLKKMFSIL